MKKMTYDEEEDEEVRKEHNHDGEDVDVDELMTIWRQLYDSRTDSNCACVIPPTMIQTIKLGVVVAVAVCLTTPQTASWPMLALPTVKLPEKSGACSQVTPSQDRECGNLIQKP